MTPRRDTKEYWAAKLAPKRNRKPKRDAMSRRIPGSFEGPRM